MKIFGWLAFALMGLTTVAHYFGGGPEFYDPLRSSEMPTSLIAVYSIIWHLITFLLFFTTVALGYMQRRPNLSLFWFIFSIQIAFGSLFIGYGLNDLGSIFKLLQWIAFFGTAAFMLLTHYSPLKKN